MPGLDFVDRRQYLEATDSSRLLKRLTREAIRNLIKAGFKLAASLGVQRDTPTVSLGRSKETALDA